MSGQSNIAPALPLLCLRHTIRHFRFGSADFSWLFPPSCFSADAYTAPEENGYLSQLPVCPNGPTEQNSTTTAAELAARERACTESENDFRLAVT
eukprot:2289035-Rhodomonas_salina.2